FSREKKSVDEIPPGELNEFMRSAGGGFLWMFTMFGQLQTLPELREVWASAHCAFRLPGLLTIATALFKRVNLALIPRLEDVARVQAGTAGSAAEWYRLPVELKSGDRNLTVVEIVVGPASGAEMLLAGIRSIRADHPTKPQQEFLAQVLAAGTTRDAAAQ